ncbi:MAG TPA: hypothetical protein VEC11_03320 [Allosphingosinicella sp.]|nr:hypothetical protein [Allosphingosinicella sp.]
MSPVMLIHIAAGSTALLSGAAALILRKGGRRHGRAGTIFFAAMLVMTLTGALIAALKPERATAVIGIITCYLVATSWWTARHRDGRAGRFEVAALTVILACAAAELSFGLIAMNSPRGRIDFLPWQPMFVFAGLAALAAALDLNFILRRQLSGAQRVGRHLWRMCAAMLIATTSFFQGQQDNFPEAWQGSAIWYLPALSVLAAMLFWIFRVRFGRSWRRWPPGELSRAPSASRRIPAPASAARQEG